MLRRERYRVKIIRSIIKLINVLSLNSLFMIYYYKNYFY